MQLRAEVTAVRKSSIFYPLVPTLMGLTSSGADIEYFIGNDYRKMGKPLGLLEHVVLQTGVHWRTSEKVHTCTLAPGLLASLLLIPQNSAWISGPSRSQV